MHPTPALPEVEFPSETTSPSMVECEEFLHSVLDEALTTVNAARGFIALVDTDRGELEVRFTAGPDWTEETRRFRLTIRDFDPDDATQRRGITRLVVATGAPYWTGDVAGDPHYLRFFDDTTSELAVAIQETRSRRVLGVLNVESPRADAFTSRHCEALQRLAQRAAIAFTMVEHQAREEALIAVGQELGATASVSQVMQTIVAHARRILRAEDCSIFRTREDGESLTLTASHGWLTGQVGKKQYRMGEGLTGWIAEHAEAIRVTDPRSDPRWKGVLTEFPPDEISAFMGVPIFGRDGLLGVLRVVRRRKGLLAYIPQEFTDADEEILKTIASQLGVALDKAELVGKLLNAERMAAWGELSARSAHMLGNALFGVKGEVNELRHQLAEAPAPIQELLMAVDRGLGRVEHILEEFRDFVRATQLTLEEADCNQLVSEAVNETFPKRGPLKLELSLAEGLPPIAADAHKLKRGFSELVENSVDFQPEGGSIRVTTELIDTAELNNLVIAARARRYVRIVFEDRGPGLSDDDRRMVFTPFFTRKAKGMGLGLSIVKGIIDAHRGLIRETGVPGNGARFEILLPAKEEGCT